jgi:hypothetical protein
MVRRGSSRGCLAGLVVATAALGACSGGGGEDDGASGGAGSPTTDDGAPVTIPDDADAGIGYLVLDGEPTLLFVRSCDLEPQLDEATGVTTELAVDLDDQIARAVSITRSSFGGDLATTTDEILVADDDVITLDSTRIDRSGTLLDLRAPGALEPLLQVDGTLVQARGVFGPPGSQDGDPGLQEGALILRCP